MTSYLLQTYLGERATNLDDPDPNALVETEAVWDDSGLRFLTHAEGIAYGLWLQQSRGADRASRVQPSNDPANAVWLQHEHLTFLTCPDDPDYRLHLYFNHPTREEQCSQCTCGGWRACACPCHHPFPECWRAEALVALYTGLAALNRKATDMFFKITSEDGR